MPLTIPYLVVKLSCLHYCGQWLHHVDIMFAILYTCSTLHTSLHTVMHYNTTHTIHTCDIYTVHELHTPSQQPVDDVLMQTLLWLHTALAHSVLL